MATTRYKGETAGERLDLSGISDNDMIQLRHKPGTIEDADKGISKSHLLSCPFGVSDTAAATTAKAASLTDSNPDFTLVSGREVVVCFTTANTASNPTLNFAGSGAIPIYYTNGTAVGTWAANTWMHLKYFYATVGNTTIQRWILLSPLPVNEITANNMNSVTSNAVNAAIANTLRRVKSVSSTSASISITDLPVGVYIVFTTDLYQNYDIYNLSILCRYDDVRAKLTTISQYTFDISLSADGKSLETTSNRHFYKCNFYQVGY